MESASDFWLFMAKFSIGGAVILGIIWRLIYRHDVKAIREAIKRIVRGKG